MTGTYNGKSVTIPETFYAVAGSKITTEKEWVAADIGDGSNKIKEIASLSAKDLYDATTSEGLAKDGTDSLKVTLYNIYPGKGTWDPTLQATITAGALKTAKVTTADAVLTALKGADAIETDALTASLLEAGNNDAIPAETPYVAVRDNVATYADALTDLRGLVVAAPENEDGIGDATHVSTANKTAALNLIDAALESNALILENGFDFDVYDTVSASVTLSDQDPTATTIDGLAASCTLTPDNTDLDDIQDNKGIRAKATTAISVKDQYGVAIAKEITYKVTNIVPNPNGYAENNFTVTGNDTGDIDVSGAERGDTFDLVLTAGGATATCAVTVGADDDACIEDDNNWYTKLLVPTLEAQRKNGLG